MTPTPPLEVRTSRHFSSWLAESRLSLAFTTCQTNRLFLIGRKPDERLSVFERHFDRPMGLHATPERLIMSSRYQVWTLDDALPSVERHDGFDRLYVPRVAHTVGDVDVHDIAVDPAVRCNRQGRCSPGACWGKGKLLRRPKPRRRVPG